MKVAELEGVGRLSDDVSCLLEGPGGILLSLSGDHLKTKTTHKLKVQPILCTLKVVFVLGTLFI